jgi:hypothetical protein
MVDRWYFARDGRQSGPFSAVQLLEMASGGQLQPQDLVWKEGMAQGVPAARVRKLFSNGQLAAAAAVPGEPAPAHALATPEPPPGPASLPPTPLALRLASPEDLELADDADRAALLPEFGARAVSQPLPEKKAPPPPQPARPLRVLGVKGGVLSSQDGARVKFRKKCLRCGYTDTSMTTMPIRSGVTRVNFFCPKCKKSQQVEIQGVG